MSWRPYGEGRYQTFNSTCSTYVIDTEKNKHVDLYWGGAPHPWHMTDYGSVGAAEEAAKARADWLNAHPDELHYDVLRIGQYGLRLIERSASGKLTAPEVLDGYFVEGPHTMDDCEYGVPQP